MNDWPKAVTTASIWISVAFALGFGLFRMNFSGGNTDALLCFLTGILVIGGVIATVFVWRARPPQSGS